MSKSLRRRMRDYRDYGPQSHWRGWRRWSRRNHRSAYAFDSIHRSPYMRCDALLWVPLFPYQLRRERHD